MTAAASLRRGGPSYCLAALSIVSAARAHPTGTIANVGDGVAWSYVCPVGDPNHHGCVMLWSRSGGVRPWLRSDHAGSDWMISPAGEDAAYLIERYFDSSSEAHRFRLLRARLGKPPVELWPWAKDPQRVGEHGFTMLADGRMLFVAHPYVYSLEQGKSPIVTQRFPSPVAGLRPRTDGTLLVWSNDAAWITTIDGEQRQRWSRLLDAVPDDELPFGGNVIFDADVRSGELWTANWGRRRFDRWDVAGSRTTVRRLQPPWLPHGVAASPSGVFLLASSLDPGREIRPRLWLWSNGKQRLIWPRDEESP